MCRGKSSLVPRGTRVDLSPIEGGCQPELRKVTNQATTSPDTCQIFRGTLVVAVLSGYGLRIELQRRGGGIQGVVRCSAAIPRLSPMYARP